MHKEKYAPFPVPSSVIKQRTENVVKTKAFCSPFSFGFSQDFGLQIWPKLPSRPFFRMCPPPHPRCVTCEGDYFSVTYSWTNTWQGVIYHFFLGFFCVFLFVFVLVFVFSGGWGRVLLKLWSPHCVFRFCESIQTVDIIMRVVVMSGWHA